MKVFVQVQVLLLVASSVWQADAHSVGYTSRSIGKETNVHKEATKDAEVANKRAERKMPNKMESVDIHTELSTTTVILGVLANSYRGAGHIEDLSITASPATTAAAVVALPFTSDVKSRLRRVPRDIQSAEVTELSVTHETPTEPGRDSDQDGVVNVSGFSEASSNSLSELASTTTSATTGQPSMGFFGSVTTSASSAFEVRAANAVSTGVTDSPRVARETTVHLGDATTSSLISAEAPRWERNSTGDTGDAGNGSSQSATHAAAMTTIATIALADVPSQATDNLDNGNTKIAEHGSLAIIIAASTGGAAAAAVLFIVVWLLCHNHRRRLERKKLQISQQEPRLSVLWPKALPRESSLVPRHDHIRIPRDQQIELVESDRHSAATVNPMFRSFNEVAS